MTRSPNPQGIRLPKQLRSGVFAILDQGFASGANFAFNLLLTRWLSPDAYGAYGLAFAALLLLEALHNGLLREPASILGPANYRSVFARYSQFTLQLHGIWSGFVGLMVIIITALVAWWQPQSSLITVFVTLAAVQVSYLGLLLARRSYYANQDHAGKIGAALLSLVYAVTLLVGATVTHNFDRLNASTALAWQGIAAAVALTGHIALNRRTSPAAATIRLQRRDIARENWQYGRWVVLASVLNWAASSVYIFVTSAILDLASAGAFKAINNFVTPFLQVYVALVLVAFPWVSARFADGDHQRLQRDLMRYSLVLAGLWTAYFTVMTVFASPLVALLYDGKYIEVSSLIPLALLRLLPLALMSPLLLGMRLRDQAKLLPVVYLVGAVITLTVGVVLVAWLGILGAFLGAVLSQVMQLIVALHLWTSRNPARLKTVT